MKIRFNKNFGNYHPSLLKKDLQIQNNINNIFKGIYLYECKDNEDNSMERFILNLFWDKIWQLPIAQNVLITNKETFSEEI